MLLLMFLFGRMGERQGSGVDEGVVVALGGVDGLLYSSWWCGRTGSDGVVAAWFRTSNDSGQVVDLGLVPKVLLLWFLSLNGLEAPS